MTNYNERLDETIAQASAGIGGFGKLDNGKFYKVISVIEAKQAITSLIKELVADAKPEKFKFDDGQNDATHFYNKAVSEYQQNLLKALSKETSQETQDD